MSAISAPSAAIHVPEAAAPANARPSFLHTYALVYALGAVWLAVEIALIGTQKPYTFTGTYMAAFMFPPFFTIIGLLVLEPRGAARTFPMRVLGLTAVAGLVSILSTVLLTPLLVLMFREGIGHSLTATGAVSWASLMLVSWPMLVELVAAVRSGRLLQASALVTGLIATAVFLVMALDPSGSLASSLHRDQGAFLMVTSSWILPVFAATVAYIRRLDTE
jgi:hypothetical protein